MAGGTPPAVVQQIEFRARDDAVALNSGTFTHALNANFNQEIDKRFRIRFTIAETNGGKTGNIDFILQWRFVGGTFAAITGSPSAAVHCVPSTHYVNRADTAQVISTGNFVAGKGMATDGANVSTGNLGLQSNRTELEWNLRLHRELVDEDDQIEFRVVRVDGTVLDSYSNTPTVTAKLPPLARISTYTSAQPLTATTHVVGLPFHISEGDLLYISLGIHGAPDITGPTGWTEIYKTVHGTEFTAVGYTRVADGSEGISASVTTSLQGRSTHVAYRISDAEGIEVATPATGTSTQPDPPNLAPSWGAADTLWLATAHIQQGQAAPTPPTNYTDQIHIRTSDNVGTDRNAAASARREVNASSEDPGVFTFGASAVWIAVTVAVEPVTEGAVALSGSALSSSQASAGLSVKRGVAAAIAAASLFAADVDAGRGLSGAAASSSEFAASLTVDAGGEQVELEGALASSSSLSGELARLRPLDGSAESHSAAAAEASIARGLDGSAASSSAFAAEIEIAGTVALAGSAEAVSHFAGAIGVTRALAGTAEASSAFAGDLDIAGTVVLSGVLEAASSLAGDLDAGRRLSGAVASTSEASADVNRQPGLAGDLASESDAEASVAVARALDGSVAAVSAFAGDFEISATLALSGAASSLSEFAAGLTVGRGLAGNIAASSAASADFVAAIGLAGAMVAESAITAALDARRSLTATATAESAWTAGLSTVAPRRAISYALRPRDAPARRADQEERRRQPRTVRRRGNLATGRR